MNDLENKLKDSQSSRNRIIVTDGVFSMDGTIAQLDKICDLAEKYDAIVMSDECHSTGFIGPNGKGVHEALNVMNKIDIITGTLGKALGGASGGFTSGPKEVIEILRQKSRPYLFSNTLAPSIVGATIGVLDILENDKSYLNKLKSNTQYFRKEIQKMGFEIKPGDHPIVPIMLYDANLSQKMSSELLKLGIYVIGFFYPVVPKGQARIRVQLSASHTKEHIEKALSAFEKVGKDLGVID
jgi:glycine C-acetyltransferase